MGTKNYGINIVGYESLAVSETTAVGLASIPAKANRAFFTCETVSVRWRADGTDPTITEGHVLAKDDSISFTGANYRSMLQGIMFISTTTADGVLKATYFD